MKYMYSACGVIFVNQIFQIFHMNICTFIRNKIYLHAQAIHD